MPLLLAVCALTSITACSLSGSGLKKSSLDNADGTIDDAITIDKESPRVETKILSPEMIKNRLKDPRYNKQDVDGEAYTEWFYSCTIDLDTEDVFRDDTPQASSTAIKVKAIKFKLALPILILLPPNADAALKKHENGHVEICSIIYGHADKACKDGARQVLGKTFNGMGKDLAEAKRMALNQVYRIVKLSFAANTTVPTYQASKLYDGICRRHEEDSKFDCMASAEECCRGFVERQSSVIK